MNGDLANVHSDTSAGINSRNVGQLQRAWELRTEGPISGAPIVHQGQVYTGDWEGYVYAADSKNGNPRWKKLVQHPQKEWMWHGFCGSGTFGAGMVFQASVEGNAYALDPESGDIKWQTPFTNQDNAGNLTDLLYHDGLLYIGLSSVEEVLHTQDPNYKPKFCGSVVALEAESGKQTWECSLCRPPHNGVSVWSSFALDPTTNTLFFDTGNNYTGEPSNLSDSMIAVDARTGTIKWSTQTWHDDVWMMGAGHQEGPDYDFGSGPQLFEATIDGQQRRLVGAGQKSGIFWAFDRENGEVVWKTVVSYGGDLGGMEGEASIAGDTIYCWGDDHMTRLSDAFQVKANVVALDASSGTRKWWMHEVQPAQVWGAGFLSDDVYLVGSQLGKAFAYHAEDGKQLWTSPQEGVINASLLVTGDTLYLGTQQLSVGGVNGIVAYRPG